MDVFKVENMCWMFCKSVFNGDLFKWNVSNVEEMSVMFKGESI